MLSPDQLAIMRAVQAQALPDLCTIQQPTIAPDAIGQPVRSWTNRATSVPCRLAIRSASERLFAERPTPAGDWVLTLPWDQEIDPEDRVLIGDRIFEVVGTESDPWELAHRAGLVEVRA